MLDADSITTTLRLIVARSQPALAQATLALRSQQTGSKHLGGQMARAAQLALDDTGAVWSDEERTQLALLRGSDGAEDAVRNTSITIRASRAEGRQVTAAAKAAGLSRSNYIRRCLSLPILDREEG